MKFCSPSMSLARCLRVSCVPRTARRVLRHLPALGIAGFCTLSGMAFNDVAHAQFSSGGGMTSGGMASSQPAMPQYFPPTEGRRESVSKYQLGPQDVLSIMVERFPDYSSPNVVVPPDGKIALPYFGGALYVTGKTTRQVEAELTKRMAKRMKKPEVTVSLIRLRPASAGMVYIIGSVRTPGSVEIMSGYRVTEVLSRAGGLTGRADEVRASLARVGKPLIKLDIHNAISRPLSSANVRVQSGDFITIQEVDPGLISITGDVIRQGVFEMRRAPRASFHELPLQPRVMDALVAAGGVSDGGGANGQTGSGLLTGYIRRKNQRIELRMQDALQLKDPAANIALQDGDYVVFEVQPLLSVFVSGEVRSPGALQVQQGSDVLQVLSQAGGLALPVDQVTASIQRGTDKQTVELTKVLSGDSTANIKLVNGDVLQINKVDYIRVNVAGQVEK
ncbi:MAG: polysaccharide biosynthesis/export protein, partial [Abditibacteriota bacterium]|nr:polysaccharide biosynthesis/export protein [Abditibacteriota bacterium]